MFRATIRGSDEERFHVSGEVVPYDLEILRQHILARGGRGTRVEVQLPPALRRAFLRALADLEWRGVELVLEP